VINSGQSQKEAVGSMVEQYTKAAMKKASQPNTLSTRRNCFIFNKILVLLTLKIAIWLQSYSKVGSLVLVGTSFSVLLNYF
jgi:hypothetical protein